MPVPPQAVWDALADPASYGYWVVGSKEIRDAEPGFPAPGTKFHHTIGFGPLTLQDHTEVIEAVEPQYLWLRAKGRPLGTAKVILRMTPVDGGTLGRDRGGPRRGLLAALASTRCCRSRPRSATPSR